MGKIDNERLRVDLGASTKNAIAIRVSRLKAKLHGGTRAKKSPSSILLPVRSKYAMVSQIIFANTEVFPIAPISKGKGKIGGRGGKKRKLSMSDADDEESIDALLKEENGEVGRDDLVIETPTRQLPARQARVLSFKEDDSDDELVSEQINGKMFGGLLGEKDACAELTSSNHSAELSEQET